jgi:Ala-tRNA(Pro) deacylase
MNITNKIRQLLADHDVSFREVDHCPAPTCQASALARGESIEIGGKTILFKDKNNFSLFVISAAKQVDSNAVRKILKSQRLRFATAQELRQHCDVEKGALPPFGHGIYPYDLYLDPSILANDKIAFNAGTLTKSFIIDTADYLTLIKPTICCFAKQ